jgi:hypothetical protein
MGIPQTQYIPALRRYEMDYAKSGSKLEEVEMPAPQGEEPRLSVSSQVMKAVAWSLFRQTGVLKGLEAILKSNTWDMIANKPKWHPEYFGFANKKEEEVYKEYFNLMTPTIILYNNLKRQYGEYLADEITARMAIPVGLAIYPQFDWMPDDVTSIDQWMQVTANGFDNRAYQGRHWVSEDKTEWRMQWTKCVPVEVLKAYGLHAYAENHCLTDHVYLDCLAPEIIFNRTHIMGAEDSFCNHTIRLPLDKNDKKEEADYADCQKVRFGGRNSVRHWEEVYKRFGEFKF